MRAAEPRHLLPQHGDQVVDQKPEASGNVVHDVAQDRLQKESDQK